MKFNQIDAQTRDKAMPKINNKPRVKKVERMIKAADYEPDPNTAVRDMLADVRHYCDAHGIDYAAEDRAAYEHYSHERRFGDH